MAGPGGGPPRKSHKKSRQGCASCKIRHIRCDEAKPQCLNCTKHKVRCPYNDHPVPVGTTQPGSLPIGPAEATARQQFAADQGGNGAHSSSQLMNGPMEGFHEAGPRTTGWVELTQSTQPIQPTQAPSFPNSQQQSIFVDNQPTQTSFSDAEQQNVFVNSRPTQTSFADSEQQNIFVNSQPTMMPAPPSSQPVHGTWAHNPAYMYDTDDMFVFIPSPNQPTALSTPPNQSPYANDLAVFTGAQSQANAHSTSQNQSPFANQQYLGVPSPCFDGWSPASSPYGDFDHSSPIVYGDAGDFTLLDSGVPSNSIHCQTGSNYSAPMQMMSSASAFSSSDNLSPLVPGYTQQYFPDDLLHPGYPMERHHSSSATMDPFTVDYHHPAHTTECHHSTSFSSAPFAVDYHHHAQPMERHYSTSATSAPFTVDYHHHNRHNLSTASAPPTF